MLKLEYTKMIFLHLLINYPYEMYPVCPIWMVTSKIIINMHAVCKKNMHVFFQFYPFWNINLTKTHIKRYNEKSLKMRFFLYQRLVSLFSCLKSTTSHYATLRIVHSVYFMCICAISNMQFFTLFRAYQ